MLNTHHKGIFIALAIVFSGACALLFDIFYTEAKNTAITKLNEEQRIHAEQAARGIEDFFATWTRNLSALAKMDEVMDNAAAGQRYLKLFYEANQEQVMAITRLDERGVIIHNFPASSSVGTDISEQKHVRELLRDHQPVISDVFQSVEGVDAVALHVPVFKGSEFKGSVGILINFKTIANRYLDVIKIGETGYAWVISRDGTILYTPIPEFTGKSVFETIKDSPSLMVMVNDMLMGHEGVAVYTFDRIGDRNVGPTRKYAVYMPVHAGNTFWSIAVASAEHDVLAGLISFRNKLALAVVALFIGGMVFSTLGAKAWLIVKEQEKRKQTEQKLLESEERFRQVAENSGDFIWEVNAQGLYTYASRHVEKILGYTPGELVGKKHFYELFEPSSREELKAAVFQVFATRQSFRNFPNPNVSKSGNLVHLESSGTPVLDTAGNLIGYRGTDTDVTERKQAELEIVQQRNEVAHLSRVTTLGEISGSLAHELNQPLGAILANTDAAELHLQSQTPNLDEVRAILADIRKDDLRAGEIIHGMRAFLRRQALEKQPLEVAQLVEEAVRLIGADAVLRKTSVGLEIPPGLPRVTGDRIHLQQVVLNLLINGMDAVSTCPVANRRITIRAAQPDPHTVEIAVSDAGVGIQAGDLNRVFDPFHTTKQGGLGLGLAICRSIVEAHGGSISVQNNPDRGATAKFSLPACEEGPTG
jgi:PAS domain S-box-containing protein